MTLAQVHNTLNLKSIYDFLFNILGVENECTTKYGIRDAQSKL